MVKNSTYQFKWNKMSNVNIYNLYQYNKIIYYKIGNKIFTRTGSNKRIFQPVLWYPGVQCVIKNQHEQSKKCGQDSIKYYVEKAYFC